MTSHSVSHRLDQLLGSLGGESWADVALRPRAFLRCCHRPADRSVLVGQDAVVLIVRYICERLSEQEVMGIQAVDPLPPGRSPAST